MCGIAGFTWRDDGVLDRMVAALRHRGPDDAGTYCDGRVSLGQRRLSVLDLSASGHQPMLSEDGAVGIVYNGEIYNHAELRDELTALGCTFRGTSDTEVFLRAYLRWGPECLKRFNGMWAACVYDRRSGTLHLSRDRIGVKPLYYANVRGGLVFASELKAILEHGIARTVNREAVDLLLSTQFVPSPMTIFEGVRKLGPRQMLTWDLASGEGRVSHYYEIPESRPVHDRAGLIAEGRRLLEDAVRIRLVADVPVGAFLSGGIDSTLVVSQMRRTVEGNRLHTVSMGFDIPGLDESAYIGIARDAFGTVHHHLTFTMADIDRAGQEMAQIYDEPVADTSSFPTLRLCQEARRWMTVALSGDGGDEIFGGYSSRQVVARFEQLRRLPRPARWLAHRVLAGWKGYGNTRLGRLAEALRVSLLPPERYGAEIGASLVYRPPAFKAWITDKLAELLPKSGGSLTEAMLKFDIYYNRLGDNYAAKVDRMSMSCGLEVRSPLLDYRFMEYSARIPTAWKLTGRDTKILMKEMIRGLIPDAIIDRTKKGFAGPLGAWMDANEAQMKSAVQALYDAGVLDEPWREFYLGTVFVRSEGIYREYKKRLYFLWRWYEHWVAPARQGQGPAADPAQAALRRTA
jgi:asparagine synthase (glutamine-hydrolysing)